MEIRINRNTGKAIFKVDGKIVKDNVTVSKDVIELLNGKDKRGMSMFSKNRSYRWEDFEAIMGYIGWTEADLAEELGYSRQMISRIKCGKLSDKCTTRLINTIGMYFELLAIRFVTQFKTTRHVGCYECYPHFVMYVWEMKNKYKFPTPIRFDEWYDESCYDD